MAVVRKHETARLKRETKAELLESYGADKDGTIRSIREEHEAILNEVRDENNRLRIVQEKLVYFIASNGHNQVILEHLDNLKMENGVS